MTETVLGQRAAMEQESAGRTICGEEIADAVAYLATARNVTGQMICVDAGQHLAWRTPDIVE